MLLRVLLKSTMAFADDAAIIARGARETNSLRGRDGSGVGGALENPCLNRQLF